MSALLYAVAIGGRKSGLIKRKLHEVLRGKNCIYQGLLLSSRVQPRTGRCSPLLQKGLASGTSLRRRLSSRKTICPFFSNFFGEHLASLLWMNGLHRFLLFIVLVHLRPRNHQKLLATFQTFNSQAFLLQTSTKMQLEALRPADHHKPLKLFCLIEAKGENGIFEKVIQKKNRNKRIIYEISHW